MAVPEQTPYIEHTGNGVTTSFALKFQCESKDHLIVLVDDVEPPIASWSLTGGNVVFTTAPASGRKITLQRNTPFSRNTDYQSYNNSFRPPAVNKDFDWIWWKLQELGVADWILGNRISALKNYVDRKDDELKAYLMEEIRKQGVALDQLDEYYNYLMQQLAQIAVNKGWLDSYVVTWTGRTQEFENKRMSRTRLGQRILHENLPSSLDASGKFYPQGGCKVGNSLFLKIGNNIGMVGASTEQFIIVEYDFSTGVKLSETAPMETLGHHELSGFTKDGKTYLVTSYQPASDVLNRSGVGVSVIEWKGASTTLANVQQFELLDSNQGVGYPTVDDAGEYIYISNKKWGASSGSGVLQYAPIFNVAVHKLSDILQGKTFPNYSFNIEIPSGDGLIGSSSINGMTATLDHLYIVFGGAYGVTQINKYTADGVLIEKIQTAIGRAARPQSEVITENLFLYNTEPEGAFTSDGKIYLITAEEWYGAGEFVKFNNKFYMARYGMTGKSPASHADHWVKVPFTPSSWTNYSPSTTYLGRNTSIGTFKRTIVEISLKTTSNYDLMMSDSVGEIPNMINNIEGQVHIYGCAQTSPRLTFGLYDYLRHTFQKNLSVGGREIRLFDAETSDKLSDKYARFASYQQDLQSRLALFPQSADTTTGFSLYGTDHQATAGVEFPYAAELLSKANRIVEFFKDGRLYVNSSNVAKIAFKLFVDGIEKFQVSGATDVTQLSTAEKVMSFGQSIGGIYTSTLLRLNFFEKAITGDADGNTYLGVRSNKWRQVNTKDLILQPSALVNPVNNGELVFEATSNTTVTIKLKGSDGIVRSTSLQLI